MSISSCRPSIIAAVKYILSISVLIHSCITLASPKPEVYVWQRSDSRELNESLLWGSKQFSRINFLFAEAIYNRNGVWDWTAVSHQGWQNISSPNFALSLRINLKAEPQNLKDVFSSLALQSCKELRAFQSTNPRLNEVQIDFDARPGQLSEFKNYLEQIRQCLPANVELTFTALGSWLTESDFVALAKRFPNFVLQVHFFGRLDNEDYAIYQSELARDYSTKANQIGVPFRIALPAYTYYVVLDNLKNIKSIEAEGFQTTLENSWQRRFVSVDFKALQKDITFYQTQLHNLSNIIWFRMPLANDVNSLSQGALEKLIRGQPVDRSKVQVQIKNHDQKLFDLEAIGTGDFASPLPDRIKFSFANTNRILSWEVYSACSKAPSALNELILNCARRFDDRKRYLPSKSRVSIGWVRVKEKSGKPLIHIEENFKRQ